MRFAGATDAANQRANEVLRPVAPAEKRVVAASSVLVAAGRGDVDEDVAVLRSDHPHELGCFLLCVPANCYT